MEIANQIEHISQLVPVSRINLGGGLTASERLNQLQADIYGRPVYAEDDPEATAFGCLLSALCTLKDYPDIQSAYDALSKDKTFRVFEPDMKLHEGYETKRAEMNRLYQVLKKGEQA